MKGDYILVTGLLIAALANLPEIQSQECNFPGTDINGIVRNISETEDKGTVILTQETSFGYVVCNDITPTNNSFEYIEYSHIGNTSLEFRMLKEFGDDFDDGKINFSQDKGRISFTCTLTCNGNKATTPISITFDINPQNTKTPEFNYPSTTFELDETFPIGLDFSDRLATGDVKLTVIDKDLPTFLQPPAIFNPQVLIEFSVSKYETTFEISNRSRNYNDSTNQPRLSYEPGIALAKQLNANESPYIFDLIATDKGNPQRVSRFPINITVKPLDVRDPEFDYYYYTSIIPNTESKGILEIKQGRIFAKDGDSLINTQINYKIIDNDGLNVELKNQNSTGVDVELIEPIGDSPTTSKMAYVVIEAYQENDVSRNETVVLAVELPSSATTTATSTSTISPSTTCPPCPTSTLSSETSTSTISSSTSTEQCTPCPNPSTDCPTGTPSTGNPSSNMTTNLFQTSTTYTTSPISLNTTQHTSTTTTNPTASVTATVTGTGTTSTSYTDCPTIACPTVTCPTESSTFDSSSVASSDSGTTSSMTVPTSCPLTCPTSTTALPCDCSTTAAAVSTPCPLSCPSSTTSPTCDCSTTSTTVTCPTITTPSGNPTVQFEKQQYSSEVVENTPRDTIVVTLTATSTSPSEQPIYTLKESFAKKYFVVDNITGIVSTAQSLPIGNYTLEAVAQIPSGDEDITRIVVVAVRGTSSNGTQFSAPLYSFPSLEGTKGVVGQVDLRSTDNVAYNLVIVSCDPPSLKDYFDVKSNGEVEVVKPLIWAVSGPRVTLTISAIEQKDLRITSIQTIVNIEVGDDNEAPQFADSSVIIGYPERTYFDPTVPMPIYTAKASDADSPANATLSYHLTGGSNQQNFDVDFLTGTLFVKGIDSLDSSADLRVQITVTDKLGLFDNLDITVKSLKDDFISLVKANSAEESLTDETFASELSRVLGYQVVVLRMEKSSDNGNNSPTSKSGFNYNLNIYALNNTVFVTRAEFIDKVNKGNFTGLSWKVEEVTSPSNYEVESVIRALSKENQSYTIATAILATLLGLTLILIAAFILYAKKYNVKRPWSQAFRAASLDVDKKRLDRSFANSNEDERAEPQVDSYNRELAGEINQGVSKSAIRFSAEKTFIDNVNKLAQLATEDEAYCPPTPVPKKSILKDPYSMDTKSKQKTDGEKKLEDTGVKFDPTPEVIQVAATAPVEPAVDLDNDTKDDDDDDVLMEEF